MTTMLRDIADRANASEETAYRSYELDEFAFRDDGPTGFTFEGVASVSKSHTRCATSSANIPK